LASIRIKLGIISGFIHSGCLISVTHEMFGLFNPAGIDSAAAGTIVGTFQMVKFKSLLALNM